MTKQHKLATITELCQTKNHKNEYKSGNEKNNRNKKGHEGSNEKNEKNEKENKINEITNHCTQSHSFERNDELPAKKCVWRKCSECGVEKYKVMLSENNKDLLSSKDIIKWK